MKPVSQSQTGTNFKFTSQNNQAQPGNNIKTDYARIVKSAWLQAEKDIEEDPYFHLHVLTHDLDEGETARLNS